jgi:hypothetical protein
MSNVRPRRVHPDASSPNPRSVPPPLEWARSHPSFFFKDGKVTSEALVEQLLVAARTLGASTVTSSSIESWSVVAAEEDWLHQGKFPIPEDFKFKAIPPFPELGQNCVRPEVLVTLFSQDVVVLSPIGTLVARGTVAAHDPIYSFLVRSTAWRRAVAFRGVGA